MAPPIFSKGGGHQYDFWLLNGHPDFAVIPGGTIPSIYTDAPIRLQVGNRGFGAIHISFKHSHWVNQAQPNGCIATLLHRKLSQNGVLYASDKGGNILMRAHPQAFIVLTWRSRQGFFTVTTMFSRGHCNDEIICRYPGHEWTVSPYSPTN